MKTGAVQILIGLAISFAPVAFAQEKEEVNAFPYRSVAASPQIVQQLEAVNLQFDEAFNKHDATAVGALYIKNAAQVTPIGTFSGREAIEGIPGRLCHCTVPTKFFGVSKEVVGIYVLPSRSPFAYGILRRLPLRVSPAESTSAPLRF